MRAIWIDEQTEADYPLLLKHGITDIFFSCRRHSKVQVDDARNKGFRVGIYWASTWDQGLTALQAAKYLSGRVGYFVGGDGKGIGIQLDVQVDIEEHDPEYVKSFFHWWRQYRLHRVTSWTMEGYQGGWMIGIWKEIMAAKILLVPQRYRGDMTPQDGLEVQYDLQEFGFPVSQIELFHDALALPRAWRGFGFTQARLPR